LKKRCPKRVALFLTPLFATEHSEKNRHLADAILRGKLNKNYYAQETGMLKIKGIDHIVLRTQNVANMLDFYTNVLHCPIERELSADVGLTQLRAGNALIDIVNVNSELGRIGGKAPHDEGRNLDHFCLQLNDITEETLVSYLKGQGVKVLDISNRYGATGFGRSIYIKDPDQNTIELKPINDSSE